MSFSYYKEHNTDREKAFEAAFPMNNDKLVICFVLRMDGCNIALGVWGVLCVWLFPIERTNVKWKSKILKLCVRLYAPSFLNHANFFWVVLSLFQDWQAFKGARQIFQDTGHTKFLRRQFFGCEKLIRSLSPLDFVICNHVTEVAVWESFFQYSELQSRVVCTKIPHSPRLFNSFRDFFLQNFFTLGWKKGAQDKIIFVSFVNAFW